MPTAYMKKAVSLHQLNQTDVEKRYHHLLLIQNISYSQIVTIASIRQNDGDGVPLLMGQQRTIAGIVILSGVLIAKPLPAVDDAPQNKPKTEASKTEQKPVSNPVSEK